MTTMLKAAVVRALILVISLTAWTSLSPSPAWAALTVPPSGLTATATQTSANSTQWKISGTEKYCWNANEWLEYQLDFGSGGSWILSLTATNQNSSSAPGLPSGYAFNIALSVDGASKGSFQVTGSTTTYKTGSSSPLTLTGIHTVRFTWTNDAYSAGAYDANIRVKQVSFLSSDTTPPTVALSSPGPSATVSGTIAVSATASDNVGIVGVQFKLDGASLGAEDTTSPYSVSWNTTTATNGSHTLTAVARDAAGNSATSSSVSVTVNNVIADTTPPTISGVSSSGVTTIGASIVWTTNEASTSQVNYGPTTAYGQTTALDSALVTSHPVALSGLTASTLYHYRVRSKDAAGNEAIGTDTTFTTAPPPDTTPPTGSVTINGGATATNNTTVTLTLSATDDRGTVAQMQYSNDGATFAAAQPYTTSAQWTLTTGGGQKTVYVKFKDAAGNWSTPPSTATITLDTTPPQITIASPLDGAVITAPIP